MNILEALRQTTISIKTWAENKFLNKNDLNYPVNSVNGKTGIVELSAKDVGALSSDTEIPSIAGLATETYVDNAVSQKSQVQMITVDTSEILSTLKIHKLTQDEYNQKLDDETLDENTLYLTPDEEIDLSQYATIEELKNKVDKVEGKSLSSNDYTNTEKNKLAGIEENANKTVVDSALSSVSTNPVENKVVNEAISNLNALVGNTKVSEQITSAVNEIDFPVDSVNGKTGVVQLTASDVGATTEGYVNSAVAQKSQVQIITNDVSEVLSTLKIHRLTQEEYDQKISDGNVEENTLYITPDEAAPVLPTVTTVDNGKILMVVNGEWAAVDLNLTVDENGVLSV